MSKKKSSKQETQFQDFPFDDRLVHKQIIVLVVINLGLLAMITAHIVVLIIYAYYM